MPTLEDAWHDALVRQDETHAVYWEQVKLAAPRLPADQAVAAKIWYWSALDPGRASWENPRVEVARALGISEAAAVSLLEATITGVEEDPAVVEPIARWREAGQAVYLFTRAFRSRSRRVDDWETDEEHAAGIDELLDGLAETEQRVLRLRFGLDDAHPRTLEEAGAALGLTPELVLEIETEVVGRMAARIAGGDRLGPGVRLP